MAIKVVSKTREEWLANRTQGIGASEVATVLGVNKWETPYQLWRRKVGLDEGKEENMAMRLGHLLEDAVAQLWAEETGRKVIANTAGDWMYVDEEKPFLRVSPDRLFWLPGEKKNTRNRGILECKTTQLTIDPDNIPMHWYCQVQMNLGVSGFRHGSIAWLTQGRDFGWRDIEFNAEFYQEMVEAVEDFWVNNVLANVAPPAITAEDILKAHPVPVEGCVKEVPEDIALNCGEYKDLAVQIKELKTRQDELADRIKTCFEEGDTIYYGGRVLATWKAGKESQKFDDKRFIAENSELAEKYMETKPGSRRFNVK